MKKYIAIIISVLCLMAVLCACSNSNANNEAGLNQMVNPIKDCTVGDVAAGLGLKQISLGGIDSTCIVDGAPTIFNIELNKDGVGYTVRIANAEDEDEKDISGVYLSGKINNAIYDSADIAVAPSWHVSADDEYGVAYCNWNGYYFSVSSSKSVSLDDMQRVANELAIALISTDNIK